MLNRENTNEEIFEKARNGDTGAFKLLFEKYKNLVYSTAYRISQQESNAKDLTQQVFLKLFQNMNSINNSAALPGWLKKSCLNLYIDEIRKQKKIVSIGDDQIHFTTETVDEVLSNLAERKIDLEFFLGQLKFDERLVTWMFAVEGFKHREIAKKLNISLSNSKQLFRRSMKKLIDLGISQ